MEDHLVAILVPIIFFLVIGAILISYFYFRSREKQIMLNKGFNSDQIVEIYKSRKNSIVWMKIGIVAFFLAFGLALGALVGSSMNLDTDDLLDHTWTSIFVLSFTGIGFIVSYFVAKKIDPNDNGSVKK
ncbi:MAG: hypothetical protein JXA68_09140 [Ignavibacteriales bacterium]|nr:hypothetical protein [Ignavibacteriales bacterium]